LIIQSKEEKNIFKVYNNLIENSISYNKFLDPHLRGCVINTKK